MVTIDHRAGVGDVGELYGLLAGRLEQIVRLDVRAPEVVIEDACQFAWSRLLHHRDRVHRETVLSWLARTAVHEAFKLSRRDRREASLDDTPAAGLESGATPAAGPRRNHAPCPGESRRAGARAPRRPPSRAN